MFLYINFISTNPNSTFFESYNVLTPPSLPLAYKQHTHTHNAFWTSIHKRHSHTIFCFNLSNLTPDEICPMKLDFSGPNQNARSKRKKLTNNFQTTYLVDKRLCSYFCLLAGFSAAALCDTQKQNVDCRLDGWGDEHTQKNHTSRDIRFFFTKIKHTIISYTLCNFRENNKLNRMPARRATL